ncbi:hypothetical protein E2562_024290 [Oryza meyeriana var. granulata]|uniref:RING-type E3 ubiquitin transferase n=1 Tax=Oryza meyeriana var. granulata TaxID=110450 RepID=A0A6G1C6X3_9ORYZ|nr:hypothetical protein E2562_024290 [Oryza meyeriana var. granulata]
MRMHPGRPTVNIRCVDWTFDGKDDGNAGTQEEESRTQQKQHHIVKESSTEKSAVLEKDPEGEADKYGESSEVEVEEAGPAAVDKVFVAVPADVKHGESTLQWTLQNLAKDGTKVVIAHVHCPAQIIPIMGAKIHYTTMNPKQVSCEKLIIEEEDIAKGLEDLIALHGITKLVMGAAADNHYWRMMSTPKSKKALRILEAADPSCKIWFTCKGHLICTREANTTVPAIPPFKFRRPEKSCRYDSSRNSDTRVSGLPMLQSMSQSMSQYEPDDDHSASPRELENSGGDIDDDIYFRLEALREAVDLKKEKYEESTKRQHAEKDLLSALQKVKELEDLCQKEIMQRKIIERVLEEQIKATEMVRNSLYGAEEQKLVMMHRITEMQAVVKEHEKKLAQSKYLEKEKLYTEFSSSELEQASRLFNEELMIGAGGFGSVYKGTLRNTTVAIKLLDQHSMQGKLEEFDQEIAVLSRVRHPNLVTLIGVCRESFGLVYEFLPEGSLEERLAHLNNNKPPLTWQVRTKIIYEICSALTFLHSNKPRPIVHGDLKPANILLDANLVSKLCDLGIYQMLMQSKTAIATTLNRTITPKGTFAYMDPEFLGTGELTPRSDVYSLGIIILRLLTGKPPQRIAEVVEDAIESGELGSILDPSAGSWPLVQANQLAQLGLRCAAMSSRSRPDLAGDGWKVVESLMSTTTGRPPSFVAPPLPAYFLCPINQDPRDLVPVLCESAGEPIGLPDALIHQDEKEPLQLCEPEGEGVSSSRIAIGYHTGEAAARHSSVAREGEGKRRAPTTPSETGRAPEPPWR